MVQTSIALLQERFRQLERVKEMRQQQERLKLFYQGDKVQQQPLTRYGDHQITTDFFLSEFFLPPRLPLQGSVHLQTKVRSTQVVDLEDGIEIGPQLVLVNLDNSRNSIGNTRTDVDTSLHL